MQDRKTRPEETVPPAAVMIRRLFSAGGSLKILTGSCAGHVLPLREGKEVVIGGNSQESQVVIQKPDVSRKYCSICYGTVPECAYCALDHFGVGTILNERIRLPKGVPFHSLKSSRASLGKGNTALHLK